MLKKIFNLKQLSVLILGFSSGFPLLLTGSIFKQWLAQEQVDIKTIGLMSLVGIAYSLKFLWSPLLDRYYLAFIGRRKTWILGTQTAMALSLYQLSQIPVSDETLGLMAAWAVAIAFFSATQDIAIDAYRREILSNEEIGLGSSMGVYGYRAAMWVVGGILVSLVADKGVVSTGGILNSLTWPGYYRICAFIFVALAAISFFLKEPTQHSTPKSLVGAVIEPFTDFFKKENALIILLFIFLFKLGDQISGSLLTPFYKDMGYSNAEIGIITKTFGSISTMLGLLIGGLALLKFDIKKCLLTFGILQAFSTAAFALITYTGPENWSLAFCIFFEDFSSGMGTSAFIAYMSSLTNAKYTATQFALLSSLTSLGRTVFSGYSGYIQDFFGWAGFFYTGALLAIPGIALLLWMNSKNIFSQKSEGV